MTDVFTKEKRSQIMASIKSVSGIEIIPEKCKELHLRHQPKGIFGRPDFANKRRKTALFIDGCFWHGCEDHFKAPKSNTDFWVSKIARNKERDREVTEKLEQDGWTVIRIWEHDLK